jgi:hypothetical protein
MVLARMLYRFEVPVPPPVGMSGKKELPPVT